MTVVPPVAFAGVLDDRPERRGRASGLAPVLLERGPLLVVGTGTTGRAAEVDAVLVGRLTGGAADRLSGRPDADVVAATYVAGGAEALTTLHGEWAAVLWDGPRRALLLACDALGARSVHLSGAGDRVAFGEDVRDVLALLPATPAPDAVAVTTWLAAAAVPDGRTLFGGLDRLPGGTVVRIAPGGRTIAASWKPGFGAPSPEDPAEAATVLREAVDAAVGRAAPPGSDVGVLLSGGLDSSTVAASLLARPGEPAPTAYSAVFPEDDAADEAALLDALVTALGLPAVRSSVGVGRPLLGGLEHLRVWGIPSTSPNTYLWSPLLDRARAGGTRVMLDGEGGDELFDSRPFHLFSDLLRRGDVRRAWALTLRYPGTARGVRRRRRARILAHFARRGLAPVAFERLMARRTAVAAARTGVLGDRAARDAADALDLSRWRTADGPGWWAHRAHALTRVPHLLDAAGSLRRTAALSGISDRHPLLLDRPLVDVALRLPPELGFDPRFDRPIARAAQAGRVPDVVRLRAVKSHFSGVLGRSMREGDGALAQALLASPEALIRAHVDPARLDALLRARPPDAPMPAAQHAAALWRVGALECWMRQLADPGFAEATLARHAPRAGAGDP